MSFKLLKLFVLLEIAIVGYVVALYDWRMETFNRIEGDTETLIEFNLRPVGRQHYLNGTIVSHVDFDDTFDCYGSIDVMVNGEWKPTGMNGLFKWCAFMITIYETFLEASFKDSNLPKGRKSCPLKKGVYYVRNVEMKTDNFPGYARPGLNKVQLIVSKNNITCGGFVTTGYPVSRTV